MRDGFKLMIVPSWIPPVTEWQWIVLRGSRPPSKRWRRGTRRAWKRAHPKGLRWRPVSIPQEPEHVLKINDTIFCTRQQYCVIRARIS